MPLPKKVSEHTSAFAPLKNEKRWSDYGSKCPTSTHRKGFHQGRVTARAVVTSKWSDGTTTKSYVDRTVCEHCGHSWDQEWMPAPGFSL